MAPFTELVHRRTGDFAPDLTPLVRSRLHAIDGRVVTVDRESEQEEPPSQSREEKRKNWYVNREYVLTFLDDVPKDNRIVRGAWWKPGQKFVRPQVSVEEEAAKASGSISAWSWISTSRARFSRPR